MTAALVIASSAFVFDPDGKLTVPSQAPDSQLATRGGGNRGRVLEATQENKYVLKKDDGFRDRRVIRPVAQLSTVTVGMVVNRKRNTRRRSARPLRRQSFAVADRQNLAEPGIGSET